MRFTVLLFIIALLVTWGCLMGALHAKHPLHNFAAIIALWFVYYLITQRSRRRRQYWRNRRQLENHCMRVYLRKNGY